MESLALLLDNGTSKHPFEQINIYSWTLQVRLDRCYQSSAEVEINLV